MKALSTDTFELSVQIMSFGITYDVHGYLEINEETVFARLGCGNTYQKWSKQRDAPEIDGWFNCTSTSEQSDYKLQFQSNNIPEKWLNWYNYADWLIQIYIDNDEQVYTWIGLEEFDKSWKSKTTRKGDKVYEYEWIWSQSGYMSTDDGLSLDQTIQQASGEVGIEIEVSEEMETDVVVDQATISESLMLLTDIDKNIEDEIE